LEDAGVHDDDELLTAGVEVVHKRLDLRLGEERGVKGPVLPALHVVDVKPDRVQRDLRRCKVVAHVFNRLQVVVAIPARFMGFMGFRVTAVGERQLR